MEIKLYRNNSEKNRVNKALTLVSTIQGDYNDSPVSIENTEIIVEFATYPSNFNYAYFNGVYYILKEKPIFMQGSLYLLRFEEDVLMTYKNGIRAQRAILDKQETDNDAYIDDGSRVTESKIFNEIKEFSSGFSNSPEFVLVVAGGY